MKFEVPSSKILPYLQIVSRVVATKSNLPALENMLFVLHGNKLHITGSEAGNRVEATIDVNNIGGEDGSFCASPRALLEPIKEMPDQPIELSVNTDTMEAEISYFNGHYTFMTIDPSTYPTTPEREGEAAEFELPLDVVMSGINATVYATSNEERRPIMTGVFFDIFEDMIVFVGSDGKILVRQQNHNVKLGKRFSFCLPKKAAILLARVLLPRHDGANEDPLHISVDERHIVFRMHSFTLWTRLLEGRYPNYNSVIPTHNPFEVTVDRQSLLSAAKRVSVFANEGTQMLRFEFTPEGIKLMANDYDYSMSGEEFVKADCPQDMHLRLGFDADVFASILSALSTEEVRLMLADQTRAGLLLPGEEEPGIDLCNLLLPMKLIEQ